MRARACALMLAFTLSACTSGNFNQAVGTPKNPPTPFGDPTRQALGNAPESETFNRWYAVLLRASGSVEPYPVHENSMRPYLAAGFALSDFYCGQFFRRTDESQRRRSFGRSTTNDVGTVIQSILGLANAGKNLIAGVGAATGLGDSIWRHYDEAFLVSADLGSVKALVNSAQDNLRAKAIGPGAQLPGDYATAQSVILRYAEACTHLGIKDLQNRAAADRKQQLDDQTNGLNRVQAPPERPALDPGAPAPAPSDPPLSSNQPQLAELIQSNALPAELPATYQFVGRWGVSGERPFWSTAVLDAVTELGDQLVQAGFMPSDIAEYCPNYPNLSEAERPLFWAGLLSSLAKRESAFKPEAELTERILDSSGVPVVSRGLLQISLESANSYGCGFAAAAELHDPVSNLRCGVRIMNRWVGRDDVIAAGTRDNWKGAARYWHPFRTAHGRTDIAGWTKSQPYCRLS